MTIRPFQPKPARDKKFGLALTGYISQKGKIPIDGKQILDYQYMNVVARPSLIEYEEKYPNAKDWLQTWYYQVKQAKWQNLVKLKTEYPSTDYVGNDRYVFNAKGNHYRLVVAIRFQAQMVYIRWFGTHAEYDKLPDASAV
jgi:mRNA interferase HigB